MASPDQLKKALEDLVQSHIFPQIDRDKISQWALLRRMDMFLKGQQLLVSQIRDGRTVDYIPLQEALRQKARYEDASQVKDYVLNDMKGDLRKFVAVLGAKTPNSICRPRWTDSDEHSERAEIASQVNEWLTSEWPVEEIHRLIVYNMAKNGSTYLYTPFQTDSDALGSHVLPKWEEVTVTLAPARVECPGCGYWEEDIPGEQMCPECGEVMDPGQDRKEEEKETLLAPVGEEEIPNGTVKCRVYSGWNVTEDGRVRTFGEGSFWIFEEEQDAGKLLQQFPRERETLEKKLTEGPQGPRAQVSAMGVYSRSESSSPLAFRALSSISGKWLYTAVWADSSSYEYLKKKHPEAYETLREDYARGVKIPFVQGELLVSYLEHENYREVWNPADPEVGEWRVRDPLFKEYLLGSELINDFTSIFMEMLERSVPVTFVSPEILPPQTWSRRSFRAGEFIPTAKGVMARLQDGFYKTQLATAEPGLLDFVNNVKERVRDILGMNPTVFGGEDALPTAEQAKRKLNQALMVLATTWNCIRMAIAQSRRNAILQLARHSDGKLYSSDGTGDSVRVKMIPRIKELLKGGWYVEVDPAIPMSWAQLRDFVESLFTQSPERASLYGLDEPSNLKRVAQGIGMTGWTVRGEEALRAAKVQIEKLLRESPVEAQDPSQMPSPSETPDPFIWGDDLPLVLREVRKTLQTVPDSAGRQNLLLWGKALLSAAAPPQPAPQGGGGSAPSPPPGPSAGEIPLEGGPAMGEDPIEGPVPLGESPMAAPLE